MQVWEMARIGLEGSRFIDGMRSKPRRRMLSVCWRRKLFWKWAGGWS